MNKIDKVKQLIIDNAKKIEASQKYLPVFSLNDFANPYIELDEEGNYNYVIRERGTEYERKVFKTKNDLLFEVFKNITSYVATDFELKNRIEGQDPRILIFNKKEELLRIINPNWSKSEHLRHQELLKL